MSDHEHGVNMDHPPGLSPSLSPPPPLLHPPTEREVRELMREMGLAPKAIPGSSHSSSPSSSSSSSSSSQSAQEISWPDFGSVRWALEDPFRFDVENWADIWSANDDLSLPKATVQKIVSEILPPSAGVSFSKDARDVLIECCVEFITLISSEANDISEKEAKKTIACDHITKALDTLGFQDYIPAVLDAAQQHKETQKVREKRGNKLEDSGMSMEELQRLQEEQFAAARERHF